MQNCIRSLLRLRRLGKIKKLRQEIQTLRASRDSHTEITNQRVEELSTSILTELDRIKQEIQWPE